MIRRGQVATGIDRYQGKAAGKILILSGVLNMLTTCYIYEKNSEFVWLLQILVHKYCTLHAIQVFLASGV